MYLATTEIPRRSKSLSKFFVQLTAGAVSVFVNYSLHGFRRFASGCANISTVSQFQKQDKQSQDKLQNIQVFSYLTDLTRDQFAVGKSIDINVQHVSTTQ